MQKNTIAIFFIILFLGLITAPSILVAIDDSNDVSVFYSLAEEEEKGNETNKHIEIAFSIINDAELDFVSTDIENNQGYYFKKYPKPHLNLISPPPEVNIL
jgi:hypothetical protein